MTKTFRAADGRKVRMSDEQIAEQEMLNMAVCIMPILTIIFFALASGII